MQKIKKGDTIQAIKGKDKGKKGKVLSVSLETGRALVEGINMAKKHKRQSSQDQKGGIISIEMPISVSNIALVCKSCNQMTKVGFAISKDGTKSRICKSCKEVI